MSSAFSNLLNKFLGNFITQAKKFFPAITPFDFAQGTQGADPVAERSRSTACILLPAPYSLLLAP
jgi:hypothetical protein